jgi:hypothetical protein
MFHHCFLVVVVVLVAVVHGQEDGSSMSPSDNNNNTTGCPDPLQAILATLDCVEQEDPVCASAGYDAANFKKLHNGRDTNTVIDSGGAYWSGAFALVDLSLEYNHKINVLDSPNQASLRYVETVTMATGAEFGLEPCDESPWGETYLQYEHALVTVNDDCQMVLWDQYGDNEEQSAVDNAAATILSDPAIQCVFGMLPAEACVTVIAIDCRSPPPTTTMNYTSCEEDPTTSTNGETSASLSSQTLRWSTVVGWFVSVISFSV